MTFVQEISIKWVYQECDCTEAPIKGNQVWWGCQRRKVLSFNAEWTWRVESFDFGKDV